MFDLVSGSIEIAPDLIVKPGYQFEEFKLAKHLEVAVGDE